MKLSSCRALLATAACLALPALARAHPGHDDGHELTWDFRHLAQHPVATIACLTVLVVAAWAGWQLVRRFGVRR